MLRTTAGVRVLGESDWPVVRRLLDEDPIASCFVAARVQVAGLSPWRLGAELWGVGDQEATALCYAGANLVPVGGDESAWRAFAAKARRQGRRCSSIVGPREAVEVLWGALRSAWGPAREERHSQPLLAIGTRPLVDPDPAVRRVRPDELQLLLPAAVAMFAEEVGVDPLEGSGGLYEARVRELIAGGRAFARIEDGRVVFKAELGAVSDRCAQVQGVWVAPELRGRGLAAPGCAAVVRAALRDVAPKVSLYVNDYNLPARRTYERVGFREVGEFMTVLF